ncbi:MAG: hypothetical protein QM736_26095 [Vicinamibacterales bacterium]
MAASLVMRQPTPPAPFPRSSTDPDGVVGSKVTPVSALLFDANRARVSGKLMPAGRSVALLKRALLPSQNV